MLSVQVGHCEILLVLLQCSHATYSQKTESSVIFALESYTGVLDSYVIYTIIWPKYVEVLGGYQHFKEDQQSIIYIMILGDHFT